MRYHFHISNWERPYGALTWPSCSGVLSFLSFRLFVFLSFRLLVRPDGTLTWPSYSQVCRKRPNCARIQTDKRKIERDTVGFYFSSHQKCKRIRKTYGFHINWANCAFPRPLSSNSFPNFGIDLNFHQHASVFVRSVCFQRCINLKRG